MTAVEWTATYCQEDDPKNKLTFDIVESGGRTLLLDERGTGSFEFYRTIERRGKNWILESTDSKPKTAPVPRDFEREAAIQNLKDALGSFPSPDALLAFYAGEPILESKINRNYDMSLAEMSEWTAKIKKTLAAKRYTRYDLTKDFYHSRVGYGDLKIEQLYRHGTHEKNWEDTEYYCRCKKCEREGPPTRSVLARTLLEMEDGTRLKFVCGNPCKGR
jgi:hypothetical protein